MIDHGVTVLLEPLRPAPVNRARMARYLELPSIARIDPITDDEVRNLDARRDELISLWHRAVTVPIFQIHQRWIEVPGAAASIEATDAYCRQLLDSGADALVIAAFTIGGRVDEVIRHHLDRDEVFEAFVLKQWAATMTEQARVMLVRNLRRWVQARGRSLLSYDGPGYNGWPLTALSSLLELVYAGSESAAPLPLRVTESGVLLPTNSMLIVFGMNRQRAAPQPGGDELLAQCHRCAMRNCRYRVAAAG